MSRKVEIEIPLETSNGVTTVRIGATTDPIRLSDLAALIHGLTNRVVDLAIDAARGVGEELSCRHGCAHCCRQLVPLSGPEAFLLADQAVALSPIDREVLFERFELAKSRLDEGQLAGMLRGLIENADEADLGDIGQKYFGLYIACPFLVEESCSVHEHRPIACRAYNVTSPAGWCGAPSLHVIRGVQTQPVMARPLAGMLAKLTGRSEELIPLPLAFDWVEANAELGMRRWPGDELVRAFAAEL